MKKASIILLCVAAIAMVSCGGNSNKKGNRETAEEEVPQAATASSSVEAEKEAIPEEAAETTAEAEPARELKWYEKDYSITVVDLDENVTYTYTRKGKKLTIEGKGGGKSQKEDMDILDDGTVQSKVYHNGQYIRTYTMERTPEEVIKLYLNSSKTNLRVIGNYPKPVATSMSDTRCGRPCWVVSKVTEEALLGYSTRKEDVYYVDKEYGFIYEKKSSASGNVGVSYKDKSHFRVTAFTDKP